MGRYRRHGIAGLILVALIFSVVRVATWKVADAITTKHGTTYSAGASPSSCPGHVHYYYPPC
jgi:hypothetical protein